MKKPVIVRAEAEADLAEAYQWYEQQVRGLGGEFFWCVDAVMAAIERDPQIYPVDKGGETIRDCQISMRCPSGSKT